MNSVRLEKEGICINGTYTILTVSSMFYFRIPEPKWDVRMKLLKSAGYNAIDVYFPWNYHETEPGVWNFEENRDVAKFLELAEENGLWVIARPGPYICSEWDGGAIPAWYGLRDFRIRQNDPAYLNELFRWYGKILPLIRAHQWTEGGAVLLLQLENELDFFSCDDPTGYIEQLAAEVKRSGIDIPLIVCCGQDDLTGSGSGAAGVVPAFNVYGGSDCSGLELRVRAMYEKMQKRGCPLLVTETNREHAWMKRLLGCGAKMLSPYNQMGGTTMDYYNAITNWGTQENPLALLTSDYDFQSMIASDGSLRKEEYIYARLYNGLLNSLGEGIGRAKVAGAADEERFTAEDSADFSWSVISGPDGLLAALSNLTDCAATAVCAVSGSTFSVALPGLYTVLLPVGLRVDEGCIIEWANSELAFVKKLPTGKLQIAMYGCGNLEMKLLINGVSRILKLEQQNRAVSEEVDGCCEILYGSPEQIARMDIPGVAAWCLETANHSEEREIHEISVEAYPGRCGGGRQVSVGEMETLGQYRGRGSYEFLIPERQHVLIFGLSDFVTVYRDGVFEKCFCGDGSTRKITLEKGTYRFLTEIWGHCNFDDIRIPSLKLGSRKGLRKIVKIISESDITDSWELHVPGKEPWIAGIDGYNVPKSPVEVTYVKDIKLPDECTDYSLWFSEADCMISVKINGIEAGRIEKSDPCLDITRYITPGTACRIELDIRRRYFSDRVGNIKLFGGKRYESCLYRDETFPGAGAVRVQNLDMPMPVEMGGVQKQTLPLQVEAGKELILRPDLSEAEGNDVRLIFSGKNLILTVACCGHIVGRVVLNADRMPLMKGGPANVVFLCGEWLARTGAAIHCQAVGKNAVLEKIHVKELKNT